MVTYCTCTPLLSVFIRLTQHTMLPWGSLQTVRLWLTTSDSYSWVGWPALATRRLCHWYSFIYKAILGLLPYYLCVLIKQKSAGNYSLRSQDCFMLTVPNARTEIGRRAFVYSAPSAWNILQKVLKLNYFISLNAFKLKMKKIETDSLRCKCF